MATSDVDYVFFWGDSPEEYEPGCKLHMLSQWFASRFSDPEQPGITFTSAEQFMMAGKARLFGDSATHARILDTDDPAAMKALGRQVAGFTPAVWDAAAFDLVVRGNFLKFAADPELRAVLLGTGTAQLVESSPEDRIWGIGLDEAAARSTPQSEWPGRNLLGKALMAARAQLKAQEQEKEQDEESVEAGKAVGAAQEEAAIDGAEDLQGQGPDGGASPGKKRPGDEAAAGQAGKRAAAEQGKPREKRQRVECHEVLDLPEGVEEAEERTEEADA
ncbi:hypothetical protein HYH02_007325 [Chlamydomonas schloesseri]|uniref:NADAR domain-containing protein n=1 Tax=Chlamydomonas schloesseri TaxID=2026947 RepID=A0A835WHU6_9CHLO|nr:hypothetical protein HYH02_007325 [Chlamydomonas schloesseri]|eukprot:KAG2447869.1 hypothetical protein HYH02_007325 [Chlamydomonas schloesseri]